MMKYHISICIKKTTHPVLDLQDVVIHSIYSFSDSFRTVKFEIIYTAEILRCSRIIGSQTKNIVGKFHEDEEMKLRGLDGWCWVQGPKDDEEEESTNSYNEGDFVFFAREVYYKAEDLKDLGDGKVQIASPETKPEKVLIFEY